MEDTIIYTESGNIFVIIEDASSAIKYCEYVPSKQFLIVQFHHLSSLGTPARYTYQNITEQQFNEMLNYNSIGVYFNLWIKDAFDRNAKGYEPEDDNGDFEYTINNLDY